jgi:homoserine dehydrogenase
VVDELDLTYAEKFGYVIKPLALGRDHGHAVEARVHPALVPAHWLLADVPGAKNALYVHSYALGPSMYYGAGAGMLPTAMSVLSDMIEVARNVQARQAGAMPARRPLTAAPRPLLPADETRSRFYLRVGVEDRPGVMGRLTTILGEHQVSIAQVIQHERSRDGDPTRIFVLTHVAREGDVRAALAAIDADAAVLEKARLLHIAGTKDGAGT